MTPEEREREMREILDGIAPMLEEVFAARAWGRLLVFLEPHGGTWIATDLQVEELDPRDEPLVEARFGAPAARANLPVLAAATHALAVLHEADLDFLQGGTFVRSGSSFHFLPGKVRTPSPGFFNARDAVVAELDAKNRLLGEAVAVDALGSDAPFAAEIILPSRDPSGSGRSFEPIFLGSYASRERSWVWGAHNPTLPAAARARVTALLDAFADRSVWEIATPGFTTDPGTAWALGALLVQSGALVGAVRVVDAEGWIMVGLKNARPRE